MEALMLDAKAETFLVLARTKNYTRAAKELFITQPAVTQHIQFLEKEYKVKLFTYKNRQLALTKEGSLLLKHIKETKAGDEIIKRKLLAYKNKEKTLKFSATLTIGEFTLAPIVKDFFNEFKDYKINLETHNTEYILASLNKAEIDFALIEGLFNKKDYYSKILKEEDFILVVNKDHPLGKKHKLILNDILGEKLIIREQGSGSREILERGLYDKNYLLKDFREVLEVGNVALMKTLVKENLGISFMYRDAARRELEEGHLKEVKIEDFNLVREFNFVTLDKESIIEDTKVFYMYLKKTLSLN